MRRFTKSLSTYNKYHLLALPCHSSVHMAHSKSSNNLSPSCSFTHSASDHPCTPPPVVPTGVRSPSPPSVAASTAAPAARSCSTTAAWPLYWTAQCSGVSPQAPKGSETSTAGGLHPVTPHRTPPLAAGETAICGVKSVSFIFFKVVFSGSELAQWQPLSLLVFVRITKLRTHGTFHNRKSEKGKTDFLRLTKHISTYLKHSLKSSFTPIQ